VIAAGDTVPITKYANQLVANLAKQPGYPADFVAKYNANIVSSRPTWPRSCPRSRSARRRRDRVRDRREDLTNVVPIAVPAAANVLATYSGVVIKASANASAAQAFLAWFAGPSGQAILASFGFLPPS